MKLDEEKKQEENLIARENGSRLATSGDNSKLAATGNDSKLATSGSYSQLATSGDKSRLAASGNGSQLAASGSQSKLVASGNGSKLAMDGRKSVGANIGYNGKIKGKIGCWITLAEYDNNYEIKKVKSAIIDGKKIKEDTWYILKDNKFKEV